MVLRVSKHLLRGLLSKLHQDDMTSAISHYLNCLLGTSLNADPKPTQPTIPDDLFTTPSTKSASQAIPEYTKLSPASLRQSIIAEVGRRFRWKMDEEFLTGGLRKKQLMRELATRLGWQLIRREYMFEPKSESEVEGKEKSKKEKKKGANGGKTEKKEVEDAVTFKREDVLCLVPIVKGTAPSVSCSGPREWGIRVGRKSC
jgi:protein TIF31